MCLLIIEFKSILNLAEKFAITHAEKYFITGEHLLLPAIEYIYIWNLFVVCEKDKRLITPILERVEKKIGQYKNEIGRRKAISPLRSGPERRKLTMCPFPPEFFRVRSTVHGQHLSAHAAKGRLPANARLPVPGSRISAAGSQTVRIRLEDVLNSLTRTELQSNDAQQCSIFIG